MIHSDYKRRSPEQQLVDLNAAWDRIKTLAATNDRQQAEIIRLKVHSQFLREKIQEKKIMLWVTTGALVALWEVAKFIIELALHIH
jgi:hypothetical protein